MTRHLRDLLEEAEGTVSRFRHPNIGDAQRRLNEVLMAAELGSTGNDQITHLRVGATEVSVETRYSVRSCEQQDSFEFPVAILDAPDPVAAARRWGLTEKRAAAEHELRDAEQTLLRKQAALAEIDAKLAALPRPAP